MGAAAAAQQARRSQASHSTQCIACLAEMSSCTCRHVHESRARLCVCTHVGLTTLELAPKSDQRTHSMIRPLLSCTAPVNKSHAINQPAPVSRKAKLARTAQLAAVNPSIAATIRIFASLKSPAQQRQEADSTRLNAQAVTHGCGRLRCQSGSQTAIGSQWQSCFARQCRQGSRQSCRDFGYELNR